jgi:hypothetical protein
MIGKIVQPSQELALFDVSSKIDGGFPDTIPRTWNIVAELARVKQTRRRGPERIDLHGLARQHTVVTEHVPDPFVSVEHTLAADSLAKSELTADRDLAFSLWSVNRPDAI